MKEKIMVISPHSDDSEFGAGGTIIKYLKEGHEVKILLIAATTVDFMHMQGEDISSNTRVEEFKKAIKYYSTFGKISYNIWITDESNKYGFGVESRMDRIPIRDVVNFIEKEILSFEPEILFIPGKSFHQDHRVVYEASITACRPTMNFIPNCIYLYELPTYSWNFKEKIFIPNVYIKIDSILKRELLSFYLSQKRNLDNKLNPENIINWAKFRGNQVNLEYCEGFELINQKII